MSLAEVTREMLAAKFGAISPHLDERQRRLLLGAGARALGRGGIRVVARAAGVREAAVSLGVDELDSGAEPPGRARQPGGGRKRAADLDPGLRPALLALVEPQERGDPMSPLRWTAKPARVLAGELVAQGHKVSADTVGGLLREEGFSLQGSARTVEGTRHPDRDAQFRCISGQARAHQEADDPVISVDTKKKELAGDFADGGREYRPKGSPVPVRTHDFMDKDLGKAIPYATTTRAGLTVRAELDPGSYPEGAKVSDEQLTALPPDRHDWHGDWNYTLRPGPPAPPPPPRPPAREPERPDWAHPALTGQDASDWNQMISELTIPHRAQRDAGLCIRRGGPPARKPADRHPPALTLAEQALVTVLRQRFRTPQHVLAALLGVVTGTIAKAERQIRPLLTQAGYVIEPAGTQLRTLAELTAYASSHGINLAPKAKPAR